MATLQAVKRRIRSVKGTRQITKAMQLVAASKLRMAQEAATGPQTYTQAARELLEHLGAHSAVSSHPLYQSRPVRRVLSIVVTADRGMAGAYNANVLRHLDRNIASHNVPQLAICVGKYSALHVARTKGIDEVAAFELGQEDPDLGLARPILQEAVNAFIKGEADAVDLLYAKFTSTFRQDATSIRLLPVVVPQSNTAESTLEPSGSELVDFATKRILEAQILQAIMDAQAGEQAARMIAMMNASDNASDLIDDLTQEYNNARQAAITQQISEISGGAEAMKE